jgi:hypothetical protein
MEQMKEQGWLVQDCMRIVMQYVFGIQLKFTKEVGLAMELFSWQGPCTAGFVHISMHTENVRDPYLFLHSHWGESLPTVTSQVDTERVRSLGLYLTEHGRFSDEVGRYRFKLAHRATNVFRETADHPELLEIVKYAHARPNNYLWTGDFSSPFCPESF